MGFTGTILTAKAIRGVDVDRVLAAFDFGPPEAANDGWFITEAHRPSDKATSYFEELISALNGPAIVVRIIDGGWAYLIAAAPGSVPMVAVMTPKALRKEIGTRFDSWLETVWPAR
jgi:hypothetical protein